MGEVQKEKKLVKLIFGLLVNSEDYFDKIERRLTYDFGDIDRFSPVIPFNYTNYYADEMGEILYRKWIAMSDLIYEYELAETKLHTNNLELLYKPESSNGRSVNIDPGIIMLDKLVLATTKNYSHRIFIGDGIYGEVTLNYKKNNGFLPNPWTYPDYKDENNLLFFNMVREDLKKQYAEQEIKY
jgi:hypothetical protein